MRHTRFHVVLWAVIAVTAVPNVGLAKKRLSFKKQGGANVSRNLRASTSAGKGQISGLRRRSNLPTSGNRSAPASSLKKLSTSQAVSNFGAANRLRSGGAKLPLRSKLGQGGSLNPQSIRKQTVDPGKVRRLDLFKSANSGMKQNGKRIGDLSKLKDLNKADLGQARKAGWIQGTGSVQGLKDLASRIQDGKIASGNLKKLDKDQLAHILKFGRASTSAAHKHAVIAAANKHCGLGTRCHWWLDVICGMHWRHHGCRWDYWCYPVYWKCWTPCNWHVVYCPATHVAYYFGVEGVVIPDTAAFGIQAVKPGSPAERAGLRPGMMIVAANGQAITSEAVMAGAIQQSGGRLDLHVLVEGSDQPVPVTVLLDVVRRSAY